MKKKFAYLFTLFCLVLFLNAQETTANAGFTVPQDGIRTSEQGFAAEEFRRGVQAFYKGTYNDAIVQFEKALSYMPDDNLILEWLGKAYYKAGMEGSALSYWQTAADNGYGGLLLENKIEVVKDRRVTGDSEDKLMRLSEAGSFEGNINGNLIFSGPVSVLPDYDGSFWVTAYSSNELLKISLNGKVIERVTGPLTGFDRPFDIIRLADSNLLVSESAGNRLALLSPNGKFIKYIGSKGRGVGNMVGPQFMATDNLGRIYVSDFGNRRVDVFDAEGNGLYYFGLKSGSFKGLKCPTGIAVYEDSVFVADENTGSIYEFDRSGNYVRDLVEKKTFSKPESIKIWQGSLLVTDTNRIVSVDISTGAVFEYVRTGNAPSRVLCASPDINNNIIVSDLTANEIYVMSKMQELVGGLFVQIEQVDASKFPVVTVEVKVENRHRQPVVGLELENFYFTENKRAVSNLQFIGSAANNSYADITIIIDRSSSMKEYDSEIETAVKEIAASMQDRGTLRVISAGAVPVTEYEGKPSGVSSFTVEALKTPIAKSVPADLAIRLASNELINAAKKRAIIMISDGSVTESTFAKYTLSELSAYLSNNSIDFSFVQVSQGAVSREYDYLINNSSGEQYYVFRPEGLGSIVKDIINLPQGVYQLKYVSALNKSFGQKYLPVETEVYLMNRSGRDESGYFAPLE
ncbi:MAG: tetratricopeptide repeat protein [Treponema sp.]|nr:tetratricopeptide repeat protein [Treponema sp.]